MNQREKLIELLSITLWGNLCDHCGMDTSKEQEKVLEVTADHLLANGVIVLPCKVGDTVYRIDKIGDYNHNWKPFIVNGTVKEISWKCNRSGKDLGFGVIVRGGVCNASSRYSFNNIGKTVFLSHEAAKVALERMNNDEK